MTIVTKIASMTPPIPRGTVSGKRVGVQPIDEAEHFFKCEACGGWFDMRDLGAVLDHEEPLPHPVENQAQLHSDKGREASPVLRFILVGSVGAVDRRLSAGRAEAA